jgi:hypothetical protein
MTDQPNSSPENQEKRIFIDEDWKAKVEAEREALKQEEKNEPPPANESPAGLPADRPLPPPTLVDLAGTLAMEAMIAMGAFANPLSGKPEVRPHQARHLIDTLALLQAKTEGNRTAEETETLEHLLHELRLGFLEMQGEALQSGSAP